MHRAHVDDAAAGGLLVHVLERRPRGEEGAVEVDREHPVLRFREVEILQRRYDLDARIAHEHVDAAEGGDRLGHAGVDLGLARYVHRDADSRIVAAEPRGRSRVGAGLIEIGDHDLGAFALKGARDLLADAGAGDDRNFAEADACQSPFNLAHRTQLNNRAQPCRGRGSDQRQSERLRRPRAPADRR